MWKNNGVLKMKKDKAILVITFMVIAGMLTIFNTSVSGLYVLAILWCAVVAVSLLANEGTDRTKTDKQVEEKYDAIRKMLYTRKEPMTPYDMGYQDALAWVLEK